MQPEIARLGGFFVLGVWLWPYWQPAAPELRVAIAACGMLVSLVRQQRAGYWVLWGMAFCLGNLCCARWPTPHFADQGNIQGKVLLVSGSQMLVHTSRGRIWLRTPKKKPAEGTRIAALFRLREVPPPMWGEIDRRVVMQRSRALSGSMQSWTYLQASPPHQAGFQNTIFVHAEHGGVLWSLATGQRQWIPNPTKQLLRETGTAHLLAISGMHISLVSAVLYVITRGLCSPLILLGYRRLGSWIPLSMAIVGAIAYGQQVGWPASAQRAVIMVSIASVGLGFGLRPNAWNLLSVAAMIILWREPAQFDSLGFQLSCSAIMGILLVTPRITRLLPPDTPVVLHKMVVVMGVSLGATLGTLPIVALHFQHVSPLSPLSNLLATPFLAAVAVPSALLTLILPEQYAWLSLATGDAAVQVGIWILRKLTVEMWYPAVGPLGAALLWLVLWLRRHELLVVTFIIGIVLRVAGPTSQLRITFIPVGQGDATLVEWPDGRRWLIDAGPPNRRLLFYLRRRGIRYLDAIFLSHPHPDHIGGFTAIVEALQVERAWTVRPPLSDEVSYQRLWDAMQNKRIQIAFPDDKPAAEMRILHPLKGWQARGKRRVNEESLVLEITHERHKFLFTGDIEKQAEAWLSKSLSPVDVVKVAHHGSRSSSSAPFIQRTMPRLAVVMCGLRNRFGHPHPQSLWRWRKTQLLRTDIHGEIEVQSSGRGELEVRVQKSTSWSEWLRKQL